MGVGNPEFRGRYRVYSVGILFLILPFLANFYKLTGMSGTYDYYEVLTNLPICNLFFAILCNLFFVNIVDLLFLIFFGKIFLPDIFATYFFAIACNLFLANLLELLET